MCSAISNVTMEEGSRNKKKQKEKIRDLLQSQFKTCSFSKSFKCTILKDATKQKIKNKKQATNSKGSISSRIKKTGDRHLQNQKTPDYKCQSSRHANKLK